MSDELLNQCGPRIIDVSSSCDASLTKADITAATPGQLVSLSQTAIAEFMMYRQSTISRMTGIRENSLFDLIMSKMKNVKKEFTNQSIGPNKSFFLPYFLREHEDVINANNWEIIAGAPDPDAGRTVAGVYHPKGSQLVTVSSKALGAGTGADVGKLAYLSSGLVNIGRYFLPGESVVVMNLGAGDVATEPFFTVIDSESAVDNGVEVARVVISPNLTDAGWDALDGAGKAPYQVQSGIVMIGANSISDYESWCHNQPSDLSRRLVAYWPQTCRFTRCYDDQYKEFLERIMKGEVNPYLERFKELPLSEQNRKQYDLYRRKLMNSIFFGQPINEHQTVEGYKNLPQVRDPRNANTFLEYKSNCLGIRTQLAACDRKIDLQGAALNINALEEYIYALKRFREVDGGTVDTVDVMTDKATANSIKYLMSEYYKKRYGNWERRMAQGEKIKFGNLTMWNYNSYELDDAQVMLNVITEPFFADQKAAFRGAQGNIASRGNFLYFLDWNDLEMGMGNFNTRSSNTPDIETDPDFRCRIKANITHYEMESCQITPIVNDPKRSLIVENFSDECPTYTYKTCSPTVEGEG